MPMAGMQVTAAMQVIGPEVTIITMAMAPVAAARVRVLEATAAMAAMLNIGLILRIISTETMGLTQGIYPLMLAFTHTGGVAAPEVVVEQCKTYTKAAAVVAAADIRRRVSAAAVAAAVEPAVPMFTKVTAAVAAFQVAAAAPDVAVA